MGDGTYSLKSRSTRAAAAGYETKRQEEIFSRTINPQMSPYGVLLREARDNPDNPESFPVILGLDITGSMGHIPLDLIRGSLPKYVGTILERGFKYPQVMFIAVGDHKSDRHPLQIGQFEASDELMDKWLEGVFIEEGGGGNGAESYHLVWYFASRYTVTDSFEKRGNKGLLITIGDDAVHHDLPAHVQKQLMGAGEYSDLDTPTLLKNAQEKYNVFHIHVGYTGPGSGSRVLSSWKQLLGENVMVANSTSEITDRLIEITMRYANGKASYETAAPKILVETPTTVKDTDNTEILL